VHSNFLRRADERHGHCQQTQWNRLYLVVLILIAVVPLVISAVVLVARQSGLQREASREEPAADCVYRVRRAAAGRFTQRPSWRDRAKPASTATSSSRWNPRN